MPRSPRPGTICGWSSFRRLVGDRYAACADATCRLVDAAAVLGMRAPLPLAPALVALGWMLQTGDAASAAAFTDSSAAGCRAVRCSATVRDMPGERRIVVAVTGASGTRVAGGS